jgi:protein-L-isoaspartate(D-aspartate) O-methyltransferase
VATRPGSGRVLRASAERAGVRDPRVLAALESVPREAFLPAEFAADAAADRPLPIPEGQTTSQPSLIALMVEALHPREGLRVLEIGTGYGYEAAVLAATGAAVWTVEVFPALARAAAANLAALGVDGVHVRADDGSLGWPEEAPFDAVIVAARCDAVPPALVDQLAEDGRLVAPVGRAWDERCLVYVKRGGALEPVADLGGVRFVPLLQDRP